MRPTDAVDASYVAALSALFNFVDSEASTAGLKGAGGSGSGADGSSTRRARFLGAQDRNANFRVGDAQGAGRDRHVPAPRRWTPRPRTSRPRRPRGARPRLWMAATRRERTRRTSVLLADVAAGRGRKRVVAGRDAATSAPSPARARGLRRSESPARMRSTCPDPATIDRK